MMRQNRLPAAYYRGGTSRAVIFRAQDLPPDKEKWPAIFHGVLGSPDAENGRQLDGMGGGISSLSKICVVGPSTVGERADVDYTFAAVGVRDSGVDYSSNCGNMSAAIGPFAVDSGMVTPQRARDHGNHDDNDHDGSQDVVVNIHNTNTGKIIRSTFPLVDDGGEAAASGDFAIDGVAGTAAPVRLDFLDPAGSRTGRLLPTGRAADTVEGSQATCIDVGNPCVFVKAEEVVGQKMPEEGDDDKKSFMPQDMEKDLDLMNLLDTIRRAAGVRMGLAGQPADVPESVPKIAMVWVPQFRRRDDGEMSPEEKEKKRGKSAGDICVRALSVGQPHRAVPVTVALSLAAAADIPGSVVQQCLDQVSHPTGLLKVDAKYDAGGKLESAAVYRTARRLMEGTIFWK
ncbi:hypothetical protein M406DRAFT_61969 [Cryphonectria parasitica EP155]|uniref:DUF453-domain-containing protein n=1 Tax=Cryphonectria parasitica (strain ATCC 38755 / EP155) TaxID=660469 RepID=A0A9P5CPC1_CRYP1|nr:uncharacterized protein M406DRAFT_61969 [Cryphonectria parasitica EP155]KAF3765021.1 hypothetical protein M406DRAFT_61969 [Cryphonectria parasitica EP155]